MTIHAPAPAIRIRKSTPTHIVFSRPFAPTESTLPAPERPYRSELSLNGTWRFEPEPLPAGYVADIGVAPALPPPSTAGWSNVPIKIPSPWNVNAFNRGDGGDFRCYPSYPRSWNSVEMGWLKRSFKIPASWIGRRILLRFDAVAGDTVVLVNGHDVAHNFDLFLPFETDITNALKPGASNEILVGVRKASLFDDSRTIGRRPYPGGSMWGQSIAGIWQDVTLEAVPAVHVVDSYVQPHVAQGTLEVDVTVRNDTPATKAVEIGGIVQPWIDLAGKSVLDAPEPRWRLGRTVLRFPARSVSIPAGRSATVALSVRAAGRLRLWSPDDPRLYALQVTLGEHERIVDTKFTRFGWREYAIRGTRLFLNGKPLELRGDSWHFMGIPQMTRRYAWAWFKALKDAHGNAVRLHAEPYPAFYLDMADEMGVCVLDETAIWGSDAGHKYDSPDFWTRCDDHVGRLVLRDRNHPSVFGWSVSNELGWWADQNKRPDIRARLDRAWRGWLALCRRLDPTRPWVSTDGDGDADGIMPASIMHYADPAHIARTDKPYGEGETGGAYYATPKYAARFAGPRAYRSQEGRMEGIAVEAYGLIKAQRQAHATYVSVFNLAWYGLQPLELGLTDTSRPYTIDDGIFFGPYRQDTPGVQPERLGPYCTTLNPGYDPSLPLYRKWPLADAIADAYSPYGPAPSTWAHPVDTPHPATVAPAPPVAGVVVIAGPTSLLAPRLTQLGATTTPIVGRSSLSVGRKTPSLVIVDGAVPPSDNLSTIRQQLANWVAAGTTCIVVDPEKSTLADVDNLLPYPIALTDRRSSSLIVDRRDPLIAGMTDGDFYFTETLPGPVIRHGLSGPFVDHGDIILEACPADWRRWNNRPEAEKTAAILRSEREAKPAGAAMVSTAVGRGRYVVTTLDPRSGNADVLNLVKRMLANEGLIFTAPKSAPDDAFDLSGTLRRAMACGRFAEPSTDAAYVADRIGISPTLAAAPGDRSGGLTWRKVDSGDDGMFDFLKLGLPGPSDNASVYLSFWIWSPRDLTDLLAQPNLPRLDLMMGSDDGCRVWLNAKLIKEDRGIHPLTPNSIVAEGLPLRRGWNHVVVKVVQVGGAWGYQAMLRSSDPKFLLDLRSSIVPPSK